MSPTKKESRKRHMVCQIAHSTISNYRDITFSEHSVNQKQEILFQNTGTGEVKMIGEIETPEDQDYVVAIVNKSTGQVTFAPVDLYNVQAQFVENLDNRLEKRKRLSYQLNQDEGSSKFEKRKSLSQTFGDNRKMKSLEKGDKRQILDETMAEMKETAFASSSAIQNGEDVKIDSITGIKKEEISDVLPKANTTAILGKDVYPSSLFITDEEIALFGDVCVSIMAKSYKDFEFQGKGGVENDFPPIFKEALGGKISDRKSCTEHCFCAAMLYLIKVAKPRNCIISAKTTTSPFTVDILDTIQRKYFKAERTQERRRQNQPVGKIELSRLIAHTLAFAMSIAKDNTIYPVDWASYTKVACPLIEKMGIALGAHKEALPLAVKQFKGSYSLVLSSPPKGLNTPRRRGRKSIN